MDVGISRHVELHNICFDMSQDREVCCSFRQDDIIE